MSGTGWDSQASWKTGPSPQSMVAEYRRVGCHPWLDLLTQSISAMSGGTIVGHMDPRYIFLVPHENYSTEPST